MWQLSFLFVENKLQICVTIHSTIHFHHSTTIIMNFTPQLTTRRFSFEMYNTKRNSQAVTYFRKACLKPALHAKL